MLELKQASREMSKALEWGFDLRLSTEAISADWFNIKANEQFTAFAEDASGGVFLSGSTSGRVLYISSEGQAGTVAMSLEEFFQLIVSHPYWLDLLKFSGGGSITEMQRALPYLEADAAEDEPEVSQARKAVSAELAIPPNSLSLQRLHDAASSGGSDIVVLGTDGTPFSTIFNNFTVSANPMWRRA